jgi:hypothetical protein
VTPTQHITPGASRSPGGEDWAASPGKARTDTHPLQEVREQQATKTHNRDLGGLIRQAIIDRLKTTGECFADDLTDLYPEGEVKLCRRLATAQFGSMVARGLIREKERRKSTFGSRKGAKAGVYIFTEKGRRELSKLAGVGIDHPEGSSPPPGATASGTLDRPAGFRTSSPADGAGSEVDVDSGETQRGRDRQVRGAGCGEDRSASAQTEGAGAQPTGTDKPRRNTQPARLSDSPEPLSLLPEPDPKAWAA